MTSFKMANDISINLAAIQVLRKQICYSREDLLLLQGGEFFFQQLWVDTVIFQVLQKLRIFEPRKPCLVFFHTERKHDIA